MIRLLVAFSVILFAPIAAQADLSDSTDVGRLGQGKKFHWVAEAAYSHFFPRQKIYSDNYGNMNPGGTARFGISSSSLLRDALGLYRKEGGTIQFTLGTGYNYSSRNGQPALPDLDDHIHSIPIDLTLTYHARYSRRQWIWPSIGVGPDFVLYVHRVKVPSYPSLNDTTKGMKYGWHAEAQLNLSLNRFDKVAATSSRRAGLTDTTIFGRGRWRTAQTPGGVNMPGVSSEGLRLTGWIVDAGLGFQFR